VQRALFDGAPCLPLAFMWIDGEMIVTRSADRAQELAAGTRVLSINGAPTAAVRERLLRIARADGANDAKRLALMSVGGEEQYESFDVFFPLAFPLEGKRSFTVECEALDQRKFTLELAPLSATERNARLASHAPTRPPSQFKFEIDGWSSQEIADKVVLLRMDTWVAYKTSWDWRAGLDAFVDELIASGARHLIVDLRENEGGNDCGDPLLARLIERPLELAASARHLRFSKVPEELNPFLETWDDTFRDWSEQVERDEQPVALLRAVGGELFRQRRANRMTDVALLSPPSKPRFTGRLWVLISATNSSATFHFAQTVKRARLGALVGTATGGNLRGINGGAFFFLRLPRTGLEVDLPLIGFTPELAGDRAAANTPDGGLSPDIEVRVTRTSIATGEDAALGAVLRAIAALR
jgi:hypothetical protein